MPDANQPPRFPFQLAVGITGHRPPVLTAAADRIRPALEAVFAMLAGAAQRVHAANAGFFTDAPVETRLITPLAESSDQLATEAAIGLGYAVQAVLLLPREDYRADFEEPDTRARFDRLLAAAECLLQLSCPPGGRDEAYALAGRATLAHSDLLVAV